MKGKTALVTGASSGIGEATAERLAMAGYKVYGTSRRPAKTGGRPFELLPLDVTRDESVEAAAREVLRAEGRIDPLVNNAGFGIAPAAAEESSMEQARSIFETNFFGIVRMTRAVVPTCDVKGLAASSTSAPCLASCRCRTRRSMPRPSTRSKATQNRSTMSCAPGASGYRSLSLHTRRRSSTRTSWSPTPSSMNTARFVRPWASR